LNETTNGVLIRRFRRSDLQNILDLARLSFAKEFELTGLDPDRVKKMVDQVFGFAGRILLTFSKLFGKEPFEFFVAEADKRVVGAAMVNKRGRVGYISTVMVHPDYRRKGIARELLKSAVDYVRRKKMKRAVLHVTSANEAAKSLYTKLGFKKFEKIAYFVGNLDSSLQPAKAEGIQIRNCQKKDADAVYELIKSSEDPKHLEVFDFKKNDLKTSFLERAFRFFTENKIVATHNNRLVGYAQAVYTTANEAGQIANVQVCPEMRSKGIEEMLIHSAVNEIKKIGAKKVLVIVSLKRPEFIAAMGRLGFEKNSEIDGMVLELI